MIGLDDGLRYAGTQISLAAGNLADGEQQIAGNLVFQHVSLDACFHSFGDVLTFFVLGQENGLDLWRRSAHFPCGIQSIQYGHTDVHYRDVRLKGSGKTKGLLPIGYVGNNLKPLTLQQGLEALANEDVVISKQDAKWHVKPPSEDELKLLFPGRLPSQWRRFRQLHLGVPACRSGPGLWACRSIARPCAPSPRHCLQ